MAQEKAPKTRARKTTATEDTPPAKTRAKAGAVKPAAKTAAATKPRTRRTKLVPPTQAAIAEHAYYLWERGEPGTPDELWLRAEQELAA